MKIGFLGNTNNYPFILAKAIKRMGHEMVFFIDSKEKLHRPEHYYSDTIYSCENGILDVSPLKPIQYAFYSRKKSNIVKHLNRCDFVILNGLGISIAKSLNKQYICILTGSDLDYLANEETIMNLNDDNLYRKLPFYKKWVMYIVLSRLIRNQINGITKSLFVNYMARGIVPKGDFLLDKYGVSDKNRTAFMFIDTDYVKKKELPNNEILKILCIARLTWKKPMPNNFSSLDDKGSDVMIKGVSLFWHKHTYPIELHLVEKGVHVNESKNLIHELGISHLVNWWSEMSQSEFRSLVELSDIVIEQLGSSYIGMGALEAMAIGRPLIANTRLDIENRELTVESPICHATNPEDVCVYLEKLVFSKEYREEIGNQSREYVEKYLSSNYAATQVISRLQAILNR